MLCHPHFLFVSPAGAFAHLGAEAAAGSEGGFGYGGPGRRGSRLWIPASAGMTTGERAAVQSSPPRKRGSSRGGPSSGSPDRPPGTSGPRSTASGLRRDQFDQLPGRDDARSTPRGGEMPDVAGDEIGGFGRLGAFQKAIVSVVARDSQRGRWLEQFGSGPSSPSRDGSGESPRRCRACSFSRPLSVWPWPSSV